jgi:phosphoribosyl 1,2-cyclic phosphodiesterase
MIRFCPLVSGSSGNSIFIETDGTKILIDAGVSGKKIESCLKKIDVDGGDIDAIFVTHEHIDHIKGVGIVSRRFDIPIYATEATWDAMETCIGNISRKNRKIIYKGENMPLNDMLIKPFEIPHDAADPVGYSVSAGDIKMTVATDIGHITDTVTEAVRDSSVLLLESNHDIDMLKSGPYSYQLKERILGLYGHMANAAAGNLLSDIMSNKLKQVFLGHLSNQNNTPELAFHTVREILDHNGIYVGHDLQVETANRDDISRCIEF